MKRIRGHTETRDPSFRSSFFYITAVIPTATSTVLDYSYTSLGQVDTIKRSGVELVNYSYKGTFVTGRSYATPSVVNYPGL